MFQRSISALLLAACASAPQMARADDLYAASEFGAWDTTKPTGTTMDQGNVLGEATSSRPKRRSVRPWYQPRVAVGLGTNIPELLTVESYLFFGRYVGLYLFYTPPLSAKVRVEMPSDTVSTKKGVGVANPAFNIRGKATYGQHYGAELLAFPFGGTFFLGGGVSHRRMRLVADAKSPILVCSIIEAAKDPPCGDPANRIETRIEATAHADVETEALLTRASLGWFWHVGSYGYFMFNVGATKPTRIHRKADVSVGIATPENSDPDISDAVGNLKTEKEADLRKKAIAAMAPVDEKVLPIIGIGAGVRF